MRFFFVNGTVEGCWGQTGKFVVALIVERGNVSCAGYGSSVLAGLLHFCTFENC